MNHLSPLKKPQTYLERWLPVLFSIGVSAIAVFMWKALEVQDRRQIERKIEFASVGVQQEISTQLQNRILAMERMADRWETQGGTPKADWYSDAKNYIADYAGFQALEWIDSSFYVRWIVPLAGNEAAQDLNLAFEERRRAALESARQRQSVTVTRTIELVQGGKGFLVYVPIFLNPKAPAGIGQESTSEFDGFILGVFRIQELLDPLLDEKVAPGYEIAIFDGDDEIYRLSRSTQPPISQGDSSKSGVYRKQLSQRLEAKWGHTEEVNLDGLIWRIRIWPTAALIAEEHSPLPEVVLVGGLVMAALLAWVAHLNQKTRRQMQQVEGANQALSIEVTKRKRTQEELQLTQGRLQFLLTASPAVIYSCRASGDYGATFMSDNVVDIFGYESREFTEDSSFWAEHIHPEDTSYVFQELPELFEKDRHTHEYRFRHKDGSYRWVRDELRLVRDDQNTPVEIVGYWIDMTDRRQAEEVLQQKSQALEEFSLNLKHLHRINTTDYADFDDLFEDCLATGCEILGLETGIISQIINQTYLIRSVRSNLDVLAAGQEFSLQDTYCAAVVRGKQTITYTHVGGIAAMQSHPVYQSIKLESYIGTAIFVNGKVYGTLNFSSTQIRKTEFQPHEREIIELMAQSIGRFIAADQAAKEQQRIEEELREKEERWQLALQGNNDGIWDWNIKTDEAFYSGRWKEILGYEDAEISNHIREWSQRVHPEDFDWVMQLTQDHLAQKTSLYSAEYRMRCKDGAYKWILDRGQALWNKQGEAVRMIGSHTDITGRRRMEEALRASEASYRAIVEDQTELICRFAPDGVLTFVNDAYCRYFGKRREELVGNRFLPLIPKEDWDIVQNVVATLDTNHPVKTVEHRVILPSGEIRWHQWSDRAIFDNQDQVVEYQAVGRDITERKRAEEELQLQNDRSRLFAEFTLKIRQSLQLEEILQTAVTEVQRFLGTDRVLLFQFWPDGSGTVVQEALIPGWPVTLGQSILDPCFRDEYQEQYRQGRVSAIADLEQANLQPCHIEFLQQFGVRANLVVPILQQEALWGLMIAHQCSAPRSWTDFETDLLRQLADQIGIALSQAQLLEKETQQRRELARSNEELQEFAYVASHDLQEPLRKIQAFGDRFKAKFGDELNEQGLDYLARMQSAARRMQNLIDDLLTLSRVSTRAQPFSPTNLEQIARGVLTDLEISIQQTGAQVQLAELPTIDADPLQIRQLLQNLLSNALKFRQPGVSPLIKLYSEFPSEPVQPPTGGKTIAKFCQLFVEDNGIGFDEKYLDRIFNPFQRLHGRSEYEGTGMGLAICRKIAERHGGHITARSTSGQGTTFIVTLPIKHHRGGTG
ncbi:MAG: PAS domain-containing protein [Leptolyngbyaceae cyanobacterium MO_188.B28]|nr:PAS domain-containing protein [Leptolyngbyaceae cyanobacterium MO_188.B28]